MPAPEPNDKRPSEILRAVGQGVSITIAAKAAGVTRKTVYRWRTGLDGFGDALDRCVDLAMDLSPEARVETAAIVRAWSPGAIASPATVLEHVELGPVADPTPVTHDTRPRPAAVEPDVLDSDGRELHRASEPEPAPYTTARPPTVDEWIAEMAAMARDKKQPERVRVTAIAAVSAGLLGGPGGRSLRPKEIDDLAVAQAARVRGRDPGVSRSVWDQARAEFLGPAPGEAEESEEPANVVEIDAAQG